MRCCVMPLRGWGASEFSDPLRERKASGNASRPCVRARTWLRAHACVRVPVQQFAIAQTSPATEPGFFMGWHRWAHLYPLRLLWAVLVASIDVVSETQG